jgi:hypothetical protein
MIGFEPKGKPIRLGDVEPGMLFIYDGVLALKSEYGKIGSIILGSGEMFSGDPGTKTDDHIVQRLRRIKSKPSRPKIILKSNRPESQ